ncbi:DNA-binding protein [candidate division KSB1 bacterium]|nr:DNA-binding protein [candidate division KSB1 bacterium]
MKAIIVDTNIIFSTLLRRNKKIRDIFFSQENVHLYSCKYAIVELFTFKEKIQKYSALNEDELLDLLSNLLKKIHIFDENTLNEECLKNAYKLCHDIDEKDIPFVAVTMELDGLLWTGDKKLVKGLKLKGFNAFFEIENL